MSRADQTPARGHFTRGTPVSKEFRIYNNLSLDLQETINFSITGITFSQSRRQEEEQENFYQEVIGL